MGKQWPLYIIAGTALVESIFHPLEELKHNFKKEVPLFRVTNQGSRTYSKGFLTKVSFEAHPLEQDTKLTVYYDGEKSVEMTKLSLGEEYCGVFSNYWPSKITIFAENENLERTQREKYKISY